MTMKKILFPLFLLLAVGAFADEPNRQSAYFYIYDDCDKDGHKHDMTESHVFVDLGLPSGLLWAKTNVGAFHEYQEGYFFAWGETDPKLEPYTWATYDFSYNGNPNNLTKYNDKTKAYTLECEDDAACEEWGEPNRMPTYAEWTELRENCKWVWTTIEGVKGYKVMKYTNESQDQYDPNTYIFLPAVGWLSNGKTHTEESDSEGYNEEGFYWASDTKANESAQSAYVERFSAPGTNNTKEVTQYGKGTMFYLNRFAGRSVRAVRPAAPQN